MVMSAPVSAFTPLSTVAREEMDLVYFFEFHYFIYAKIRIKCTFLAS